MTEFRPVSLAERVNLDHLEAGRMIYDGSNLRWAWFPRRNGLVECIPPKLVGTPVCGDQPGGPYLLIRARVDGALLGCYAHNVIWLAHRGNIPVGHTVNHIDGHGLNNSLDNLNLMTMREQMIHASRILGRVMGSFEGRSKGGKKRVGNPGKIGKIPDDVIRSIRYRILKLHESRSAVARELGMSKSNLDFIVTYRRYTHVKDEEVS